MLSNSAQGSSSARHKTSASKGFHAEGRRGQPRRRCPGSAGGARGGGSGGPPCSLRARPSAGPKVTESLPVSVNTGSLCLLQEPVLPKLFCSEDPPRPRLPPRPPIGRPARLTGAGSAGVTPRSPGNARSPLGLQHRGGGEGGGARGGRPAGAGRGRRAGTQAGGARGAGRGGSRARNSASRALSLARSPRRSLARSLSIRRSITSHKGLVPAERRLHLHVLLR